MTDAAKSAKAKYQREWRARNKDKVRATNARYWQKKAQKALETEEGKE